MDISQNLLQRTLDGLWTRQQITTHNIANYSTPEYKSKKVDFETSLKEAIQSEDKKSVQNERIINSEIDIKETTDLSMRLDGNNVDIEKENLDLAETQIHYMYTVSALNSYFAKLRTAIKGQ